MNPFDDNHLYTWCLVLVLDAGLVWVAVHHGIRPTHSGRLVVGPDWRLPASAIALRLRCHVADHRSLPSTPSGEVVSGNVGGLLSDSGLLDLPLPAIRT